MPSLLPVVLLSAAVAALMLDGTNARSTVGPSRNGTSDISDSNCLHACLDECMEWRNMTFTSDDCLIPCAVYVEESERIMHENSAVVSHCNDSNLAGINLNTLEKPGKVSIRMTRMTATNITEIWWTFVPMATAYRIEIWCKDGHNDTMLFDEETWLTWYSFRQCAEKCPSGARGRVAAWNTFGVGEFSEFSDPVTPGDVHIPFGNSTSVDELIQAAGRRTKLIDHHALTD